MASTPRFTILCATYNQADYLPEMVASITAQTWQDWEAVVVDDGSTDGTPAVLGALLEEMPEDVRARFRVERTANGGQTAAYEHGFAVSRGEWICLLDSDDRFLPEKLAVLAEVVDRHPDVGFVQHPLRVVDPEGRPTGAVRPQGASLSDGDVRAQMRRTARHSSPGASGLVFRRDVMARMFPAPTKRFPFAADAYLSFGAVTLAPVRALDRPLGDYRMQPGGQYLKRMVSAEGLRRQVEFQDVVAGHFGLLGPARRNSFFARNRYASAMYDGTRSERLRELSMLLLASARDPFFGPRQKVVLTAFWLVTFVGGPGRFPALWRWFQRRQTGWHQVGRPGRARLTTTTFAPGAGHPAEGPGTGPRSGSSALEHVTSATTQQQGVRPGRLRIALIVPFLNEEQVLPQLLQSLAEQRRQPDRVVLVDDGSTDGSTPLAQQFCAEQAHASLIRREPRAATPDRLATASEYVSFQEALSSLAQDWDVAAKLDADLRLPDGMLTEIEQHLVADPTLGIVGTFLREEQPDGSFRRLPIPEEHVHGATKFYRRGCWEDIAPQRPILGWDSIDERTARMLGWRTQSVSLSQGDPVHLRPRASYDGRLRGFHRFGRCDYALGEPAALVIGLAWRYRGQGAGSWGAMHYLAGYVESAVSRAPRASAAVRGQTRREEWAKVRRSLAGAIRRTKGPGR